MHEHPHEHDHVHAHKAHSPEEALALLSYMADHNKHHAEELHELAHDMDDASAALIHEAAIGKIAGDQLLKLQTLGLTEEEAEDTILKGFLA